MNNDDILKEQIRAAVGQSVAGIVPLGGGSISSSCKVLLHDSSDVFVKHTPQVPDMFVQEANGLSALRRAKCIRVPDVIHADHSLLVLEFLPASHPSNRKRFFEVFGRTLAQMHKKRGTAFGFSDDNYIGSTPQINTPVLPSWRDFFWVNRLLFQYRLAEKNGYATEDLRTLFADLENNLSLIIPDDGEPPALLHGDLWSGNYLCVENDVPAIIDPAVYYGHREADLGMTLLFGGFSQSFYSAYNEEYPLLNGWEERMEVYKLYHLFNHMNLFGDGYLRQVHETLRALVR